jgi:hypothetical protein
MKTILELMSPGEIGDDYETLIEIVDGEILACRTNLDLLGMGEWLAAKLPYTSEHELESVFVALVTIWSSPVVRPMLPGCIGELIDCLGEFSPERAALAFVRASLMTMSKNTLPVWTEKLAFRLEVPLRKLFELGGVKLKQLPAAAASKLEEVFQGYQTTVASFLSVPINSPSAVRNAAIQVVRVGNAKFKRYLLPDELPYIGLVDNMLGPQFRNFCDAYEKNETARILKQAPMLREAVRRFRENRHSTMWLNAVQPIARHILKMIDEVVLANRKSAKPVLRLATSLVKLDLSAVGKEVAFSCRLRNEGDGQAYGIKLDILENKRFTLAVASPRHTFEIPARSEQIVTFSLVPLVGVPTEQLAMQWTCKNLMDEPHRDTTILHLEQQSAQPDWDDLYENPPYTLKPVKTRDQLFGRSPILEELRLNAAQGKSTFLWGQKRVGKTSLLQVLAAGLRERQHFICILLRMGELRGLHEGQIAYTIASRLSEESGLFGDIVPAEDHFGLGLGKLVHVVERFVRAAPKRKLVCIIDEFDDFDPAFYTGERGKQLIKALRSVAEEGLTFFFAGSERMNAIYQRHHQDLNIWSNIYLDHIESLSDCQELVIRPVEGRIEYQVGCVEQIAEYCNRNPFYIHLLCSKILSTCLSERRTFVADTDVEFAREHVLREMAEGNLAHFWEDNPDLDSSDRIRHASENCLILAAVSHLPRESFGVGEVLEAIGELDLGPAELLDAKDFRNSIERLKVRRVLASVDSSTSGEMRIQLPIFHDWLDKQGEPTLTSKWRQFRNQAPLDSSVLQLAGTSLHGEANFPIAEDDLLMASENLVYCGKQRDVAEIRLWLRQFDDDVRIELAFTLLKRLAEKGHVSEGARTIYLGKVEEMIEAKRRNLELPWRIFRGKKDNLCIAYTDSEIKSGAEVARDLAKRIRPGKLGPLGDIKNWMGSREQSDGLVIIVDDFSGTGSTISNGLKKSLSQISVLPIGRRFLREGRIVCFLLYAFPEALERLRAEFPEIDFNAAYFFGEEVRSLSPESGIFASEDERKIATDMLQQIGRELCPQFPFGYGDMGALICFHDIMPNNSLPIFWSNGTVAEKAWRPLFPRK